MSIAFYQILHVFSLLVLTGFTFYAFAAPASSRKRVLMITGIASVLMFISGFGLITKIIGSGQGMWPLWIWIKLVAWLGLSSLTGVAFKKRDKALFFMLIALGLIFIALYAFYTKIG